jgi:hypothetical protein
MSHNRVHPRVPPSGGESCPSCKRPFAPEGVGAVTEDTLKFCLGTGTPACIEWTRKIDTGPGQPPANPFGMSDQTVKKLKVVGALGTMFGAFFGVIKIAGAIDEKAKARTARARKAKAARQPAASVR